MPLRSALVNLAITFALLLAVVLAGILMRARQEQVAQAKKISAKEVLAIMGGEANEAQKSTTDQFEILPSPVLVESYANEGDTLRVRFGMEEYVFVLYYVDALETNMDHPSKVSEQGRWFQTSEKTVVQMGKAAAAYVTKLLNENLFNVLTRWERVPNTARYYAIVKVHLPQGPANLADLLILNGFARVGSLMTELPGDSKGQASYLDELRHLDEQARIARAGIWERSSMALPVKQRSQQ
jgi:endonuclease YncB( thermonuclease family)